MGHRRVEPRRLLSSHVVAKNYSRILVLGQIVVSNVGRFPFYEFYFHSASSSYLHCEWKSADELEQGDKRVVQKIKRFKVKQQSSFFEQVRSFGEGMVLDLRRSLNCT